MNLFIFYLWKDPVFFFTAAVIVCFSICFHELFHALVALSQGDDTAANRGHLTLNPLKQMGWTSLIMFLIIGIAWGQVPVNRTRLKHRYSDALVSFSGPAANLLLFLLFSAGLAILYGVGGEPVRPALQFFLYGGVINLALAIINLMPVPGLDGWHLLAGFFPGIQLNESEFIRGFFLVMIILVFFFIDKIFEFSANATVFLAGLLLRMFGGA